MRILPIIALSVIIASCQISPSFDETSYGYLVDARFNVQHLGADCLAKDGDDYWAAKIDDDAEMFLLYTQYRDTTVYPAAQTLKKLTGQLLTRAQSGKMDEVYCKDKTEVLELAIDRLRQALAARE
jgi:hypothetical protein